MKRSEALHIIESFYSNLKNSPFHLTDKDKAIELLYLFEIELEMLPPERTGEYEISSIHGETYYRVAENKWEPEDSQEPLNG